MSYTVALVLDPLPTAAEARDLAAMANFEFDPKEGEGLLLVTVESREELTVADAAALARKHGAHVLGHLPE